MPSPPAGPSPSSGRPGPRAGSAAGGARQDPLVAASGLMERGEFEAAIDLLKQAVFKPNAPLGAYGALAVALERTGQADQAEFYLRKGLRLAPGHVGLTMNLGRTLRLLGKREESIRLLEDALAQKPTNPEIAMELGEVYTDDGRWAEVVELVDRAVRQGWVIDPLLRMRATVLHKLGRLREAVAFVREAQWTSGNGLEPAYVVATLLNYDAGSTAQQVAAAHRRYGMILGEMAEGSRRRHPPCTGPDRPLRVGLISPDLRRHSVSFFGLPLAEAIAKNGHALICYSSAYGTDEFTRQYQGFSAAFRRVAGWRMDAIADLIQSDQIDVLIELSGLTTGHAQPLMALKPAPVQMSYIGYPASTGNEAIDFRLVDALTDPPGSEEQSVERLLRMDPCFLCYRPQGEFPPVRTSPRGDRPFTFASFNTLHKVNDETLALWAKAVNAVEGSRLLLKLNVKGSSRTSANVLSRVQQAGLEASRVTILPSTPSTFEHLRSYDDVDVALDPWPYHGTTTTCEAFLMGVPVISLVGDRHAARVGLSLSSAVGLSELAVDSPESFVAAARRLASSEDLLMRWRQELRERLLSGPLGDFAKYANRVGEALRTAWREACGRDATRKN